MKKTFKVCVQTTFNKWYEIEAESAEQAQKTIIDGICEGDFDDTIDTDDIDTTITEVNEVK